ncbi:hypothetical protein BGZ61DRAFT_471112 [Ilyonectria robusta]|uniref:uncharacterized protein n=1 Tax=Ilyonectria robusta TaxID=1079257 RepID=UPI001E8E9FBD|nr:uncharacterized protein BGZ61DRAFT_471112 [Ilyonectria robusta]KAH8737698.1 hypothetical protein BGZ61DRAFT_471112 [Ilyonectria robusta]
MVRYHLRPPSLTSVKRKPKTKTVEMVVKGALSLLARPSPRKGGLCLRCLVATGVPVACTGIMMDRANRPTKAVMAAQISIGMQGIETWSGERQWHQQPRRARLTSTVRQGHWYYPGEKGKVSKYYACKRKSIQQAPRPPWSGG